MKRTVPVLALLTVFLVSGWASKSSVSSGASSVGPDVGALLKGAIK